MAQCPCCRTPGAYVGFVRVECRNPDCVHFVAVDEERCSYCGLTGHTATECQLQYGESGSIDIPQPENSCDSGTAGYSDPAAP